MSLHPTTRQALAAMPPDKSAWLKSHCKIYGHDLSNAVSVAACFRGAITFERWCSAIASRLRTDKKCQAHGAINRNHLKNLQTFDFDEFLGDFQGFESLGFGDPSLILEARQALEAFLGKKPRGITATQLAADIHRTPRQCRNILKKQAEIEEFQGDLFAAA